MRRAMCKPREIIFKQFSARLTELNNYLTLFLGLSASNKMPPEELNEILLHAVPSGWAKYAYLQSWDFEIKRYKATYDMFKQMEVTEKFYKGVTPSKTSIGVDANRASHGRKRKGGESTSPNNPEKGCAGKRKTKMQAIRAIGRPEEKHNFCMSPGTIRKSTKYSSNTPPSTPHSGQTTKKQPSLAAIKNVVRLSSSTVQQKKWKHGNPWCTHPNGKEGGKSGKNPKSDKDTAVPSDKERKPYPMQKIREMLLNLEGLK